MLKKSLKWRSVGAEPTRPSAPGSRHTSWRGAVILVLVVGSLVLASGCSWASAASTGSRAAGATPGPANQSAGHQRSPADLDGNTSELVGELGPGESMTFLLDPETARADPNKPRSVQLVEKTLPDGRKVVYEVEDQLIEAAADEEEEEEEEEPQSDEKAAHDYRDGEKNTDSDSQQPPTQVSAHQLQRKGAGRSREQNKQPSVGETQTVRQPVEADDHDGDHDDDDGQRKSDKEAPGPFAQPATAVNGPRLDPAKVAPSVPISNVNNNNLLAGSPTGEAPKPANPSLVSTAVAPVREEKQEEDDDAGDKEDEADDTNDLPPTTPKPQAPQVDNPTESVQKVAKKELKTASTTPQQEVELANAEPNEDGSADKAPPADDKVSQVSKEPVKEGANDPSVKVEDSGNLKAKLTDNSEENEINGLPAEMLLSNSGNMELEVTNNSKKNKINVAPVAQKSGRKKSDDDKGAGVGPKAKDESDDGREASSTRSSDPSIESDRVAAKDNNQKRKSDADSKKAGDSANETKEEADKQASPSADSNQDTVKAKHIDPSVKTSEKLNDNGSPDQSAETPESGRTSTNDSKHQQPPQVVVGNVQADAMTKPNELQHHHTVVQPETQTQQQVVPGAQTTTTTTIVQPSTHHTTTLNGQATAVSGQQQQVQPATANGHTIVEETRTETSEEGDDEGEDDDDLDEDEDESSNGGRIRRRRVRVYHGRRRRRGWGRRG